MYKVRLNKRPMNRAHHSAEAVASRNCISDQEVDNYSLYSYDNNTKPRKEVVSTKVKPELGYMKLMKNHIIYSPKHLLGAPGGGEDFKVEKIVYQSMEEPPHYEVDNFGKKRRSWIRRQEAATLIQAAYRGYSTRKKFWKKRERARRKRDIENEVHGPIRREFAYRVSTDPPPIRMSENGQLIGFPTNVDPHMGRLGPLSKVDLIQKENMHSLGRNYFDSITPPTNDLQDEHSSVILMLGGFNPKDPDKYHLQGCSVYVYIVEKDKWFFGGTLQEPRAYHGAVLANGRVYVTGGLCPGSINKGEMVASRKVFQLNIRGKRWRPRAAMHQSRAYHGICEINNSIYVFGGKDDEGRILSTVEVYDTTQDKWTMLKSLPKALMAMAVVVLDQIIYVIGGLTHESGRYQFSTAVYMFDAMRPEWLIKCHLPEPLAFCNAVTLRREIWLFGGATEKLSTDGFVTSTNSILTLKSMADPRWEVCPNPLTLPKHSVALAKTMGRRVFVLGGMSSEIGDAINENDVFDRESMQLFDGSPLPYSVTGAAAVSLPPDTSARLLRKWGGSDAPEAVKELAATKIQARFRGHMTRSLLEKCCIPQSYGSPVESADGNTFEQKRHTRQSLKFTTRMHDDFRKFKTVTIAEWPPSIDPTSLRSEVNVAFDTQPPGYTVAERDHRAHVKRYIPLSQDCDPNLGSVQNVQDSFQRTRKSVGLRRMEPMPYAHLEVKGDNSIRDDCIPIVLLLGGLHVKEPTNYAFGRSVLKYNPLKNCWQYIGVMPEPRNHHAAAYLDGIVYVTGGLNPDSRNSGEMVATRNTFAMNVAVVEWIRKSPMLCTRAFHSLVPFNGKLYAIGGRDHNGRLVASIECYDPKIDKWVLLRPMSSARMGIASAVFENKIWCMGGIGTGNGEAGPLNVLSTVQSYDPDTETWTNRPPLRCPRAFGFCLNVNKKMWLCAGCCRIKDQETLISMASVDCYNGDEASWERITILSNPRHCCAVTDVEDCIYLFGGMTSQEWSAQKHNEMIITTDHTINNCADLPYPLTGLAAVTIPPHCPSLRAASLSYLLHYNLSQ